MEYCSSCLESAGERPWQCCGLRASGGSSKIDCQLSYIQATLSCRQQKSRDVFRRTWGSWEPGYRPLWAMAECRSARYYTQLSLHNCDSHHLVLATVPDRTSGPGPGPNQTVAKLAVRVVNKTELPTRVRFHGKLPTRLNRAGSKRVAQQIHL